uniref:Uncharacterized protein n=1 Tax=Physcomitrium patens TaxID=3218 RepID=A0A2K1K2E9_PHYPA|nr:hypothetical protein PHYPA_012427 [Physcomitrium patens]
MTPPTLVSTVPRLTTTPSINASDLSGSNRILSEDLRIHSGGARRTRFNATPMSPPAINSTLTHMTVCVS